METQQLPWEEKNWYEEFFNWLKNNLNSHHIRVTGKPQQIHAAPWSVVYQVPSNQGLFFFKALCPVLQHEPGLTKRLWQWQPHIIQPVLEIEPTRGWMLMPDGGETLRQFLEKDLTLNYWKKILPAYARFQQSMISHRQELLALGVIDRGLAALPDLAASLAADRDALCVGQSDGLSVAEYDRFNRYIPKLHALCECLANYGIPETLEHDDFHDGNIFVVQKGFRFFDFAESFIAHPFFTLVVTLRSIAYRFDLAETSPDLDELKDLYLMEWREYTSMEQLYEAFDLAMILGRINRALTWHRVVSSLPEPYHTQEADAVPGWIQLFLEKITPYA